MVLSKDDEMISGDLPRPGAPVADRRAGFKHAINTIVGLMAIEPCQILSGDKGKAILVTDPTSAGAPIRLLLISGRSSKFLKHL